MSDLQMLDASQVVLTSMTEEEFANYSRKKGKHIVFQGGRYWEEVFPGLYQPSPSSSPLECQAGKTPSVVVLGIPGSAVRSGRRGC